MKPETEEMILSFSKEFDEKKSYLTCEFSLHKDKIDEFELFVKSNVNLVCGKWILMQCETCEAHHGKGYLHASIERLNNIPKLEKAYNFIRTIN